MNHPFLQAENSTANGTTSKAPSWWNKTKAAFRKPQLNLGAVMGKVDREELTVGCQGCQRTFAALEQKIRSHPNLGQRFVTKMKSFFAKKNADATAKVAAEERRDSGVALEDDDDEREAQVNAQEKADTHPQIMIRWDDRHLDIVVEKDRPQPSFSLTATGRHVGGFLKSE